MELDTYFALLCVFTASSALLDGRLVTNIQTVHSRGGGVAVEDGCAVLVFLARLAFQISLTDIQRVSPEHSAKQNDSFFRTYLAVVIVLTT
jgi:hypothetical protein